MQAKPHSARTLLEQRLRAIQQCLVDLYALQTHLNVDAFLLDAYELKRLLPDLETQRESLLIIETDSDCELAVCFDDHVLDAIASNTNAFDAMCLALEGVSHFLYVVERVDRGVSTSLLELELQAEVDKYAVHLFQAAGEHDTPNKLRRISQDLRTRLYENVHFLHAEDSEQGQRYRNANMLAQRYTARLEEQFLTRRVDLSALKLELRRFYRLHLNHKLNAAA